MTTLMHAEIGTIGSYISPHFTFNVTEREFRPAAVTAQLSEGEFGM